jgi:hypothetical protein
VLLYNPSSDTIQRQLADTSVGGVIQWLSPPALDLPESIDTGERGNALERKSTASVKNDVLNTGDVCGTEI